MKCKLELPALLCALALTVGCNSTGPSPNSPESGQSAHLKGTFAGKNACNPEDHDRPFIIEWDATDMSSFEQYAMNDIVIVKYEGCKLKVLDECRNDSVRGSQGAYRPPEWTTGQLEKIDIESEADLYAKLPLGEATLGGRVNSGEKFHMEYYVSGTRQSTRPSVYRADLDKNPGCEGATHFVYAYNLGAFALGTKKETTIESGGSIYGFGAGGSDKSKSKIDKRGGDLALCRSESAREIEGCKSPIRLNLRKVREGEDPNKDAMKSEDTSASLNAAGQVNTKIEMSAEARARLDAALAKTVAGDGRGCLVELDAHDMLDPTHKSTDPKSGFGLNRAQCLMIAGQCDAGKGLGRKSLESTSAMQMSPEQLDSAVEAYAMMWCQGKMSDRDALLKALMNLRTGAYTAKKDAKFCAENYKTAKALKPKVKPKDDEDRQIIDFDVMMYSMAPLCFQRAEDCPGAEKVFTESYPEKFLGEPKSKPEKEAAMHKAFEQMIPKCAAK